MARLTDEQWESLEADYHTGKYSKNELAKKYNITHTSVNKRLKSVVPKFQDLVSTQIAINTELSEQSFKQVSAIETAVEEAMRNKKLINDNATKLANKINNMTDEVDNAQDIRHLVEANDKLAITLKVADRHAPKQDISLQNNQQNIDIGIKRITISRRSDRVIDEQ